MPRSPDELVAMANDLLTTLHVPIRVKHMSEIADNIFVLLVEGLCCKTLPDVVREPRSRQDQIHNCQMAIDYLSLDMLHTSLSHIVGEDIIDGYAPAIEDLLVILHGLLELIIGKIESDASSTDGEGTITPRSPSNGLGSLPHTSWPSNQISSDSIVSSNSPPVKETSISLSEKYQYGLRDTVRGPSDRYPSESSLTVNGVPTALPTDRGRVGTSDPYTEKGRQGGREPGISVSTRDALGRKDLGQTDVDKKELYSLASQYLSRSGESSFFGKKTADLHGSSETTGMSERPALYALNSGKGQTEYHSVSGNTNGKKGTKISLAQLSTDAVSISSKLPEEFQNIGVRPRPAMSSEANVGTGRDAYRPLTTTSQIAGGRVTDRDDVHHQFTHHLYHYHHHYDPPGLDQLSSDLVPISSVLSQSQRAVGISGPSRLGVGSENPPVSSVLSQSQRAVGISGPSGLGAGSENPPVSSVLLQSQRAVGISEPSRLGAGSENPPVSSVLSLSQRAVGISGPSRLGAGSENPPVSSVLAQSHHTGETNGVRLARNAALTQRYDAAEYDCQHIPSARSTEYASIPQRPQDWNTSSHVPSSAIQGNIAPSTTADVASLRSKYLLCQSDRGDEHGRVQDLNEFIERTVDMTRRAVKNSPTRTHMRLDTDRYKLNVPDKSSEEVDHLARSLNLPSDRPLNESQDPLSCSVGSGPMDMVSPSKRKVSFLIDRSTSSEDTSLNARNQRQPSPRMSRPQPKKVSSPAKRYQRDKRAPSRQSNAPAWISRRAPHTHEMGSYMDLYPTSDTDTDNDQDIKLRYRDLVNDLPSDDDELVSPSSLKHLADKRVCFEELLDRKSKGVLSTARKHIGEETIKNLRKAEYLHKIYGEDFGEIASDVKEQLKKDRLAAAELDVEYKKSLGPKIKRKPMKSSTAAQNASRRKRTKPVVSSKCRKRSVSASPGVGLRKPGLIVGEEDDILPFLLEEFPYLHLSSETWHELWRKGINQIEQLTKSQQDVRRKKSQAQSQLEDAELRQQLLVKIMRKELAHNQRMRDLKDRKSQQVSVKNKLHEKRMQSARSRKYYEDYDIHMRSRMLKRSTKEEMVFKKLFNDALGIQKERLRDLRNYAKEQRERKAVQQQNEILSLENHYRDQFEMLAASMAQEQKDLVVAEKSKKKIVHQMKKELRKKMEKEIEGFQEQLYRSEDDTYFRQLDADRLRHELQMAKYQAKVI